MYGFRLFLFQKRTNELDEGSLTKDKYDEDVRHNLKGGTPSLYPQLPSQVPHFSLLRSDLEGDITDKAARARSPWTCSGRVSRVSTC